MDQLSVVTCPEFWRELAEDERREGGEVRLRLHGWTIKECDGKICDYVTFVDENRWSTNTPSQVVCMIDRDSHRILSDTLRQLHQQKDPPVILVVFDMDRPMVSILVDDRVMTISHL